MTAVRSRVRPALVPELKVTSLEASQRFRCGILGFRVLYDRLDQGFAAIEREGVQFMLDQDRAGLSDQFGVWDTGRRERPFGRGINFEITVTAIDDLPAAVSAADRPVFFGPEEFCYRVGTEDVGVKQCLVQDPDGYLLRLSQAIGCRSVTTV